MSRVLKYLARLALIVAVATFASHAMAQNDFDPWAEDAPIDKVQEFYEKEKAKFDKLDPKSPQRSQLDPFLRGYREYMSSRGFKFDKDGKITGGGKKTGSATGGGNKPAGAAAGAASSAVPGFFFDGLQYGTKQYPSWAPKEIHLGGASFFLNIETEVANYCGTKRIVLKKFEMHSFAFTAQTIRTILGLSTAIHELEHIRQFKEAWEKTHQAFRDEFKGGRPAGANPKKEVEDLLKAWFRNRFNVYYTGQYVAMIQKAGLNQPKPREHTAIGKQEKFKKDFAGKSAADGKKQVDATDQALIQKGANLGLTPIRPGMDKFGLFFRLIVDDKSREAKRDCKIGYALPEDSGGYGEETGYAIAVQVPERCVGTWHYLDSGQSETTSLISISYPGIEVPEENYGEEPQIPVCTGTPTGTPTSTPQPQDTPASKPPEEETPPSTTTQVPKQPEETETPDLGLVKAAEEVVELALASAQTGASIASAAVKLLAPSPALPSDEASDDSLASADNYKDDVPAANLDENGAVLLSLSTDAENGATELALAGEQLALVEEEQEPSENASASGPAPTVSKQTLKVDTQPSRQMIVAAKAPATSLAASFAPAGSKICVNRGFLIGQTPVFVVKVPEPEVAEFTEQLENSEAISFFEPDPCREKEINDTYFKGKGLWGQNFDNQWAIKRVNIDEGKLPLKADPAAQPVRVAVIDTGADWYHPDLPQSKFWINPGEIQGNGLDDDGNGYVDDLIGWNFVRSNQLPWDYDGHGTFVAGVIAAEQDNGIGIAGINPSARIMVLKALDVFGRGHASMVAEAIAYAADNGAQIINLSLGGEGLTAVEKLSVDYAREKGAVLVVASGNDGKDVANYSPAGLEGVVTVTATDRKDRRAGFSNWGAAVDIAAPGVDVLSLRARRTDLLSIIPGVKYEKGQGIVGEDRAYYRASGTSFATPIVSGTLSLLLSRRPEVNARQAVRMLLQSARDTETPGVDNYTGYGLLDADAALKADPEFFVESRIHTVRVVGGDKPAVRVIATVGADQFDGAVIMLGKGDDPRKWLRVNKTFTTQVSEAPLVDLPAQFFAGSQTWTIRLITRHKNGARREARFKLTVG